MSTRADIRQALIDRIKEIVDPSVHVAPWDGEDAAFNEARIWPAVYVCYEGTQKTDNLEVSRTTAALWQRRFVYTVYVCAVTTQSQQGDEIAMDLLEQIEEGLLGYPLSNFTSCIEVGGLEELIRAQQGHFLYVQPWEVRQLEQRT